MKGTSKSKGKGKNFRFEVIRLLLWVLSVLCGETL
jgi:hypothetical protein